MRNENGPVAHGKDAFLDAVTADHARAFLHVGDAILSVLLNAFEGKQPDLNVTREPYERFTHLNERIDRAVGVEARVDEDGDRPIVVFAITTGSRDDAIEIRVEPSRLLYGVDRSAYIEVLETAAVVIAVDEADQKPTAPDETQLPEFISAPVSPPSTEVIPSYNGRLATLRPDFERFLETIGLQPALASAEGASLADSLLATADQNIGLDWKEREALQARLKVSCKRVLVKFGFEAQKAEDVAERLVEWMRLYVPNPDVTYQGIA